MSQRSPWPTRRLFDVRIDALSMTDVVGAVATAIETRERLLIGVVNAAKMVKMQRDSALRRAVLGADMILADGMSVVWASRLVRAPLPERVAGIDLMVRILELCNEKKYRVFCFGATEEVLASLRSVIAHDYPGVQLVGARNGYYDASEEPAIAEQIAESKADVLFVGMTSPRKEMFLANWCDTMGVPVCHGVGGAFDVLAGKVRRAPHLVQRAGMEWAFRVAQEPRRLAKRYIDTNSVFIGMLAREKYRDLKTRLFGKRTNKDPWKRVRTDHH
ncbi:MAG: WecB/TagA/CpsF family glycosyltransferase [Phycisphaerales bacterium]|nr:WecB/TagA/CpsF family glycosyltransferase [Phycisphaerales bacterium]